MMIRQCGGGDPKVLTEVLEMMNEVWELPSLVHFLTGGHNTLCEGARPTTKHADFADVAVLLLDKL